MAIYSSFSTMARIEPDSLLPKDYAGIPVESKMVDFAVYLESDDITLNALRQLAARESSTTVSWNHTCYTPLLKRPLAMSIETRLTGRDWNTAKIQMSIWMSAQLNKLEQLVAQDGGGLPELPFLPVIVTQGHEWYFLAATRSEKETVCSMLWNMINSILPFTGPLGKDTPWLNTECARGVPDNCRLAGTRALVRRRLPAVVQSECDWCILVVSRMNASLHTFITRYTS